MSIWGVGMGDWGGGGIRWIYIVRMINEDNVQQVLITFDP